MKVAISIVIILLVFSCSPQRHSSEFILNNDVFSQEEMKSIQLIVEYFETNVGIDESNLNKSYISFIQQTYSMDYDSIPNLFFTKKSLRSFIKSIPKSIRDEIWKKNKATAYRSYDNTVFTEPINYLAFDINPFGRYYELLKELSVEDKSIKYFIDQVRVYGTQNSLMDFRGLIKGNKEYAKVDLESYKWRMIIAIYYITMIEEVYRFMELKKN